MHGKPKAEENQRLSNTFVFERGSMATHFRAVQAFTNLFQKCAEGQSVSGMLGFGICSGRGTAKRAIFYKSRGDPNDNRDEDRDGPSGFEDRAARARSFAAEMGLQAYALLAAAQGAVDAYAQMIGEDWKPYEAPRSVSENVSRQSAAAEMAAFAA
jgi:hypothetical protein